MKTKQTFVLKRVLIDDIWWLESVDANGKTDVFVKISEIKGMSKYRSGNNWTRFTVGMIVGGQIIHLPTIFTIEDVKNILKDNGPNTIVKDIEE
jgi:hypothetical protein